jgi:hypothetical protein
MGLRAAADRGNCWTGNQGDSMHVINFCLQEWLLFLLVVGFILFIMYPKSNGGFDDGYFKEKHKEKYWWEKKD